MKLIQSCISNLNFNLLEKEKRKTFSGDLYLDIIKLENDNFIFSTTFLSYLSQDRFKTFELFHL
jgi:hypothetical protein